MSKVSLTCPHCGITSYHPTDAEQGYCGRCHVYVVDVERKPESRETVSCERCQTRTAVVGVGSPVKWICMQCFHAVLSEARAMVERLAKM